MGGSGTGQQKNNVRVWSGGGIKLNVFLPVGGRQATLVFFLFYVCLLLCIRNSVLPPISLDLKC